MQRRIRPVLRTWRRFAVDHHNALNNAHQTHDPLPETRLEHLRVQQPEDPAERVVRRRSVGEFQTFLELGFIVFSPFSHIHPTLRAAQDRAQREHNHLAQIMLLRWPVARVFQSGKHIDQRYLGHVRLLARIERRADFCWVYNDLT
jgi:hypothetical protein